MDFENLKNEIKSLYYRNSFILIGDINIEVVLKALYI